MILFIVKNQTEGREEYCVLLPKENFTCANVSEPYFANFIKISMEIFILLQNKTCFSYHKVIFSMPHLLAYTIRSCLCMKIESDYQGH